ncbi:DUF397 domain-containing protein [Streptomyces griseocarneus]|uniref:DUF397 domain-containing protein n=1 Tax=Streptomyces griseocarneus TaxID=51201 RepID=UPI0019A94780|nr:DUF397 domain-containing protein [Streptomyces griseocarneus]GHG56274.1 hypothetical protein GCM10018779_20190 [Streptomyces griseocarneus]
MVIQWQKSSFSTDSQGDCIELANPAADRILLRESDAPNTVIATSPAALRALLATATGGRWR